MDLKLTIEVDLVTVGYLTSMLYTISATATATDTLTLLVVYQCESFSSNFGNRFL